METCLDTTKAWFAVPFTATGYLKITEYRDQIQKDEETGNLKKFAVCLAAELGYAALLIAGITETVVRTFFAALAYMAFSLTPISLREKLSVNQKRVDLILLSLLTTSSYLSAQIALASASNLLVNFCAKSVQERQKIYEQIDFTQQMLKEIKKMLRKNSDSSITNILIEDLVYGITTKAYFQLTRFRDGNQDESLLTTAGRRITAELGYATLAVVGIVEIVIRTAFAAIAHLYMTCATEFCREYGNRGSMGTSLPEEIRIALTFSIYPVAVTTCVSVANLVNNFWSTSLLAQNNLIEQFKEESTWLKNYRDM